MRAQDHALLRLARLRGLLDPEQEARVRALGPVPGDGFLPLLLREGLLAPDRVSALLRELAASRFTCAPCGQVLAYDALAAHEDLVCPACRRPLGLAGGLTSSLPSGAFPATRPSGAFPAPGPRPTGSFSVAPTVRPSDRSPVAPTVRPSDRSPVAPPPRASGGFSVAPPSQPSGHFPSVAPPSQPSGQFPSVAPPSRPSGGFPMSGAPRPSSGHQRQVTPDPVRQSRASERTSRVEAVSAPRRLGPYTLTRELGRGMNGVVWLAEREGVQRAFAVKILSQVAARDPTTLERFRVEAQVASRLEHPGIVAVVDAGLEADEHYYVMAYCAGPTLQDRLREGPLPPAEAAALVLDLARAVAHAHRHQVLHRDIKPANVILDPSNEGRPKITDFGLARDLTKGLGLTQAGDLVGTPYYMAPERFREDGPPDARLDIYALGVVLYECLTGRRPFEAQTPVELAAKVEAGGALAPDVANPGVPAALSAICLRAMARRPADRHPTADALAADLEGFLRSTPVAAARASSAERPAASIEEPASRLVEAGLLALLLGGAGLCVAVAVWAFGGS